MYISIYLSITKVITNNDGEFVTQTEQWINLTPLYYIWLMALAWQKSKRKSQSRITFAWRELKLAIIFSGLLFLGVKGLAFDNIAGNRG